MADTLKIPLQWERLPCDTAEGWEAFKSYRDMRPHRIQNVCGWPTYRVQEWSKACNWEKRVRAYDAHLDGVFRGELEATLQQSAKEVAAEHMSMLAMARQICTLEFSKMLELTLKGGSAPGAAMRVGEVIKLSEIVVKLDRLVRGESTENVAKSADLSKLTDAELEVYERALSKVDADSPPTAH